MLGANQDYSLSLSEAPLRYYRALYAYNPYYHSPNDEGADEELCFIEGDIIVVRKEHRQELPFLASLFSVQ